MNRITSISTMKSSFTSLPRGGTLLLYLGLSICGLMIAFALAIPPVSSQVLYVDDGRIRIAQGVYSPHDGLEQLGYPLSDNDNIMSIKIPGSNEALYVVERAKDVEIVDHDGKWQSETTGRTVRDLIEQESERMNLGELDRVTPSLSTVIEEGMAVTITRVSTVDEVKEEKANPGFKLVYDSTLPRGKIKTINNGKPGLKEVSYRYFYKNGKLTLTKKTSEKVIIPPKPGIKHIGSQIQMLSKTGYRGKRVLEMEATAYDAGPISTGKWANGRTFTGAKAVFGVVAVDPRVIPLGTQLFIEGYGKAVALDIGGAIKGLKIDLFFESRLEA
ncbi:MAG: 3D domain-containing protein, partial [bacterium]